MMAYLKYGFTALIALILVTVALANRSIVTVQLLPEALASILGFNFNVTLPLFLILALAVGTGLLLGFIWEWFREHAYRAEAARLRRKNDEMRDELERVRQRLPHSGKDEVLALVDSR